MRNRRQLLATSMLVFLTFIWGLTFPATKAALETITPFQFLAFRFTIGSVLFLPIMVYKSCRQSTLPHVLYSLLSVQGVGVGSLLFIGFVLQATGMKFTTASRSGFFTGLLTLIVPFFAMIIRTSKTTFVVWLALPVAMSGIYLLADPSIGGLNKGDLLTIGCAAVFALQMIALEGVHNRLRTRSADANTDNSTDILTFTQTLVVGVGCTILSIIEGESVVITSVGWWGIVYTAVFGSVIAVWLQTRFQPKVPAGYAGMIFTLEPLWAAFFAWLLLGEGWTSRGLVGAVCIICAMAISSLGMKNGQ